MWIFQLGFARAPAYDILKYQIPLPSSMNKQTLSQPKVVNQLPTTTVDESNVPTGHKDCNMFSRKISSRYAHGTVHFNYMIVISERQEILHKGIPCAPIYLVLTICSCEKQDVNDTGYGAILTMTVLVVVDDQRWIVYVKCSTGICHTPL